MKNLISVIRRNRTNIFLSILVITSLIFLLEYTLRICLFNSICDIPQLKKSSLYTKNANDNFWLLEYHIGNRWTIEYSDSPYETRPFLGWDTKPNLKKNCIRTDENRAKIYETLFDNTSTKILFYGDSFTAGGHCSNNTIPSKLEKNIKIDVLNFGVGGYGFDQTFLKFNSTYNEFKDNIILIGLLYDDLDRSILKVRNNQKVYFELDTNGELFLKKTKIYSNPDIYFHENKPKITSYLFNLFYYSNFGNIFFHKFIKKEETKREKNIKNINKLILKEIINIKKKENLTIYFVLFYDKSGVESENWRHIFFKRLLDENNITYFDTKNYLLNYSRKNNISVLDLYLLEDGHHNDLGNTVIAKGISKQFMRKIELK